jgi:hypothetical protein
MPYHEAFWVAAGTAAPVIALALAVALADVGRTFTSFTERGDPKPAQIGVALALAVIAVADFIAMGVVLAISLFSLAQGVDRGPPSVTAWMLGVGLTVVLVPTLGSVLLRNLRLLGELGEEATTREDGDEEARADAGRARRRATKRGLVGSSPVRCRLGRG